MTSMRGSPPPSCRMARLMLMTLARWSTIHPGDDVVDQPGPDDPVAWAQRAEHGTGITRHRGAMPRSIRSARHQSPGDVGAVAEVQVGRVVVRPNLVPR